MKVEGGARRRREVLGVPVALRWRAPRLASLCGPGGQSAVRRGELKPLSQLGRGADGAAAPLPLKAVAAVS